jgi:hypothetical protein
MYAPGQSVSTFIYVTADREISEWKKKDDLARADREPDPIKRAIMDRRLTVGMTLEQARQAMGRPGFLSSQTTSGQSYWWPIYGSDGIGTVESGRWHATFEDGKIVSITTPAGY